MRHGECGSSSHDDNMITMIAGMLASVISDHREHRPKYVGLPGGLAAYA